LFVHGGVLIGEPIEGKHGRMSWEASSESFGEDSAVY
jgi:hypothetical protein